MQWQRCVDKSLTPQRPPSDKTYTGKRLAAPVVQTGDQEKIRGKNVLMRFLIKKQRIFQLFFQFLCLKDKVCVYARACVWVGVS